MELKGIYAISDEVLTPYNTIKSQLQEAINGGISIFQFRDKSAKDEEIESLCEELQEICKKNKVLFVLNDRVNLAIKINAQALHLGKREDNEPYTKEELLRVRKKYHGILGISCYDSENLAQNAKQIGADYVAFGSCFLSAIKPNAKRVNLSLFTQDFKLPKCAIGGINKDNIKELKNADMVACISSIWQGDIKKNVENLRKMWK